MQSYNQKMRHLPIELVATILQSFSSTLSKTDTCASRALTIVQQKIATTRTVARFFLTGGGGGH